MFQFQLKIVSFESHIITVIINSQLFFKKTTYLKYNFRYTQMYFILIYNFGLVGIF